MVFGHLAEHHGEDLASWLKHLQERKMDFNRMVLCVDPVVHNAFRQCLSHRSKQLQIDFNNAKGRLEA